jgi:RNA polymerase sigma-70 factor (ECF subfamily)
MNPPPFDIEAHVHRHGEALRRLARELVAEAADAEDALQDAWLGALRSPPRHTASVGGWLATLVRNVVGKSRRRRRRRDQREGVAAALR